MALQSIPSHLQNFLKISTSPQWCESAIKHFETLLIDHAHCERKAAASAIQLMSKHPLQDALIQILSPIAREELLHFEKMLAILKKRNIKLYPLHPCRYHKELHAKRTKGDNVEQLIDDLVIAAIIEARSCERFFTLLPYLEKHGDTEVFKFYSHLAMAEQRHFEVYLELAASMDNGIEKRIEKFIKTENSCIQLPEALFRFHSGLPN